MSREGGTYGGSGEARTRLWWGELSEREHLEDVGVDGE